MSFLRELPDGSQCDNCHDHPADLWVGDSASDMVHGMLTALCNCCTVRRWREQAMQLLKGATELEAEIVPPCTKWRGLDDEAARVQPPI